MVATSRPRQAASHKVVSESVREREMFRHWPPFQNAQGLNDARQWPADTERLSSADIILTALTQLGIYQLGAERTFMSLFDSEYQYFIAEATSGTYLRPLTPNYDDNEPFRLCGTAARRNGGACEYTLLNHPSDDPENRDGEGHHADHGQLPVTVIPDLGADAKFSMQTLPTLEATRARFYAAVPIRTKRGINIGVYCVTNTSTRQWTDLNTDRMRDISSAISNHLEAESLKAANRRNTRMNRGLGSFLEGSTTLSGWQLGPNPNDFADVVGTLEGNLNSVQQSLQRDGNEIAQNKSPDALMRNSALPKHENHTHLNDPLSRAKQTLDAISENGGLENVFSRAANIIRESVEVEGCVFLDMTMASYRAHQTRARPSGDAGSVGLSSSTSSDESTHRLAGEQQNNPMCDVKGISTSASSSIDRGRHFEAPVCLSEKFMRRMSKRYPKGKIFNFSIDGELQTSDSSGNEQIHPEPLTDVTSPPACQESPPALRTAVQTRPLSRQREGKAISAAFPGARSVAFFPVWDSRLEKWCASGLIYTNTPSRVFTVEGELSYLRAFGMLAATEIGRLEALQAEKAKSDALGSLSHELRSPLHGVLLSTELMADTKLDVFQSNIAHTIETCSRTLLDTIDHLLDYSKVNSFADLNKHTIGQAQSHQRAFASEGFGKKSLVSDYLLDDLVEDVVESVFAGFNFQRKSINQHVSRQQNEPRPNSSYADDAANSASDYLDAMDQLSPQTLSNKKLHFTTGSVTVVLSLDASCDWLFRFQVGALRRIVMNIVGNALKYTSYGTITISLTQQVASIRRRKPQQVIKFTVEDTGKGINEEFLQKGIFKPFSQEDGMSPGTGLGLNLVKQIVSQLRGQISIDSQVGIGTVVSILLPLERPKELNTVSKLPDAQATFRDQIRDLAGLRVRLMSRPTDGSIANLSWRKALECACLDWLRLEVLAEDDFSRQPDLVLWAHDTLPSAPEDIASLAQTPNVVIYPDAVAAYEQTRASEAAGWRGIFEFISQPVGPRKLAKTLSLAYSRWTTNEGSPPTIISPSAIKPSGPNQRGSSSSRDGSNDINSAALESPFRRPTPIETTNLESSNSSGKVPMDPFLNGDMAVDKKSDVPETPNKFLLVDDNHINLKILAAYMKKMHLTYDTATNGKEAVDQYTQSPQSYACILLDISMPVMDGFEAARRIRGFEGKEGVETAVPIFALSGLASEEAQREAYGSGIDLFLLKPVKLQVLGETLKEKGILVSPGQ
ncbi:hypothetical protein EDB81DRAFT_843446 [Dactylonectria macrodidyma]|uniref:Uncharacterized protein n=1 Tax=Dactylonectria macrodidyma TaxID=307937 RepID=A0A9P9J3J7_9HYPO|nr:hypothetical protein EDB81DRAFT_843446 [Dactylonectria macrodidyma]